MEMVLIEYLKKVRCIFWIFFVFGILVGVLLLFVYISIFFYVKIVGFFLLNVF